MFNSRKINGYLDAMAQRGIRNADILIDTRITPKNLSNIDFVADSTQSQTLISNMIANANCPELGFELGNQFTTADMGAVGYGMLTAPTIKEAIDLWRKYATSLYGTLISMETKQNKLSWNANISAHLPAGQCFQFCMEEYLMQVLHLGKTMTGYPISLSKVQLSYPPPKHSAIYNTIFDCEVSFNEPINSLTVLKPGLNEIIQSEDRYLHDIYKKYCIQQSGRLAVGGIYSHKVRNYLIKNIGNIPSIDAAAQQLHISNSTLHRRLQSEGLKFSDILNDFRNNMARDYLKETNITPKQLAHLLGYTDTKPFLRAFKLWTGVTVGEYRKRTNIDL